MKRLLKWLLAVFLYYSGILRLFERFNGYSREGLWVLEYHRVSDANDDILKMVIPVRIFEKQMRYLKKRYNIVSFKEAVDKIDHYRHLPRRTLVITFDDGYKDFYLSAYPILKKLNIKATVFLVTDFVGTENLLWFDELVELVRSSRLERVTVRTDRGEELYDLSNANSKDSFILRLLEVIKNIKVAERQEYLKELKDLLEVNSIRNEEKIMLNWQEVKEMSVNEIEFGSHGRTHTILTTLDSPDLDSEILESKKIIEENTGQPVYLFSYPNGRECDFNDPIISKLYHAGYKAACMNVLGKNIDKRDLFKLKRRGIEKESSAGLFGIFSRAIFACEISGIFDLFFFRREREYLC